MTVVNFRDDDNKENAMKKLYTLLTGGQTDRQTEEQTNRHTRMHTYAGKHLFMGTNWN